MLQDVAGIAGAKIDVLGRLKTEAAASKSDGKACSNVQSELVACRVPRARGS